MHQIRDWVNGVEIVLASRIAHERLDFPVTRLLGAACSIG